MQRSPGEYEAPDGNNQNTPHNPDFSPASTLAAARAALDRGDEAAAEELLAALEAEAPHEWEVYHLRGILHARRQAWEQAERCFQQAHQLNPTHPAPLTNLGNLRTEQGRLEEALPLYQQALSYDPDYANAHHNLAVAYRRLGRLDDAVRHLKQVHRLEGRRSVGTGIGQFSPAGWLLLLGALAMLAAVFGRR